MRRVGRRLKSIGMTLNVEMVTFDCDDPARLASWWADQVGGTTQELIPGEFIVVIRLTGSGWDSRRCPIPPRERIVCTSISGGGCGRRSVAADGAELTR